MLVLTSGSLCAADITLESDTSLSSEGYFVLNWTTTPEAREPVVIQQSLDADFSAPVNIDVPANGAITLTGFDNGTYYFRAQQSGAAASDTVVVEVAHHSLARAFGFFLAGLILFIVLTVTIIRGNRLTLDEGGVAADG